MKRRFIALAAAICLMGAADASAQGGHRPHGRQPNYRFDSRSGLELSVGYLHSNYAHKDFEKDDKERDKGLDGLYVSMTKDFTLVRRTLYFQTGATYAYQNATNRFTQGGLQLISDRNEHYVDIPVKLKFAMNVIPNLRAFVTVGPTLDFGLSSKLQYRTKLESGEVGKYTYNYYNGKSKLNTIPGIATETPASAYRRFDIDMGFAVGAEIYDIATVKLGFDWGMINKNKNRTVADYLVTHRNLFHLGLGVRF